MKNYFLDKYRVVILLLCLVAGVALYTTWLFNDTPPSGVKLEPDSAVFRFFSFTSSDSVRNFWEKLDIATFTFLNGSLESNQIWAGFWAVANNRAFDIIAGIAMGIIILLYLRRDNKRFVKRRFAFCLVILLFTVLSSQILINSVCKYNRLSPTKIMPEKSVFLSEVLPVAKPKDKSSRSFPGDHAIILFSFAFSLLICGEMIFGGSLLIVAVLFALPRLFSGAHWLTDITVGMGFILFVSLGILFATPLHRFLMKYSLVLTNRIFKWKVVKITLGKLIYM